MSINEKRELYNKILNNQASIEDKLRFSSEEILSTRTDEWELQELLNIDRDCTNEEISQFKNIVYG